MVRRIVETPVCPGSSPRNAPSRHGPVGGFGSPPQGSRTDVPDTRTCRLWSDPTCPARTRACLGTRFVTPRDLVRTRHTPSAAVRRACERRPRRRPRLADVAQLSAESPRDRTRMRRGHGASLGARGIGGIRSMQLRAIAREQVHGGGRRQVRHLRPGAVFQTRLAAATRRRPRDRDCHRAGRVQTGAERRVGRSGASPPNPRGATSLALPPAMPQALRPRPQDDAVSCGRLLERQRTRRALSAIPQQSTPNARGESCPNRHHLEESPTSTVGLLPNAGRSLE